MTGTLSIAMRHRFRTGRVLEMEFEAGLPGVVGVFGPSGAGKSTLVATLAGSFRPDWSAVALSGRVLSGDGVWVRPERRRIGLVFQDDRLFPHLGVADNLRYGLKRAAADAIGPGFDEVVGLLGLERLVGRRIQGLSGGERKRVAIGRALLSRPALLAMDEPLAGLDQALRAEILPYLARLRDQAGLSILYVTHSRREVALLCDMLVLVEEGRVVGSGPVGGMLSQGVLGARADAAALLDGVVARHWPERGLSEIRAGGFVLVSRLVGDAVGSRVRVSVPAREVIVLRPEGAMPLASAQTMLPAVVREVRLLDGSVAVVVLGTPDGGGQALLARVTRDSVERLGLAPGVAVVAMIKSMSLDGGRDEDG